MILIMIMMMHMNPFLTMISLKMVLLIMARILLIKIIPAKIALLIMAKIMMEMIRTPSNGSK